MNQIQIEEIYKYHHYMAFQPESECLKLLESGNIKYVYDDIKVLAHAIHSGREKVLKMLLDFGSPVTFSSVGYAILCDKPTSLEILLQHALHDVKQESTVFDLVSDEIKPSSSVICEILIRYGFDVNKTTSEGSLPLTYAIQCANIDVIRILLHYGAIPCLKYTRICIENHCVYQEMPLHFAFSLQSFIIKEIIKYAALHVEFADYIKLEEFLLLFELDKAKPFLEHAKSCLIEVQKLKSLKLISYNACLFDFLISQGDYLKYFVHGLKILNEIIKILAMFSLPIYQTAVLSKFKREDILSCLFGHGHFKFHSSNTNENVVLNFNCMQKIYSFLSIDDLFLILKAFLKV